MLDDCAANQLAGARLPSIALPSTKGTAINLATLSGRSLLIIYPWTGRPGQPNPPNWDDIPGAHGSTPELEGFRDRHAEFARLGLRLFGLSRQTTGYQRELAERLALPFPILSEAEGRLSAELDLPTFATGGETYLRRLTLLSRDGKIERVFYPIPDPAGHAADILRWVEREG
jgi:peroxiredoxin